MVTEVRINILMEGGAGESFNGTGNAMSNPLLYGASMVAAVPDAVVSDPNAINVKVAEARYPTGADSNLEAKAAAWKDAALAPHACEPKGPKFAPSSNGSKWELRCGELARYVEQHGNANVSKEYTSNPQLGRWVDNQRTANKNGSSILLEERKHRLGQLGFQFSTSKTVRWELRYSELARYVEKHGNTNVPRMYESNRQLGSWVDSQRFSHKHGNLSEERKQRLQQLGFQFEGQTYPNKM